MLISNHHGKASFYHVPFCHYQQKKKTSEEVVVNRVLPKTPTLIAQTNGHSTTTTPAQSSEDSGSDGEKEIVSLSQ